MGPVEQELRARKFADRYDITRHVSDAALSVFMAAEQDVFPNEPWPVARDGFRKSLAKAIETAEALGL